MVAEHAAIDIVCAIDAYRLENHRNTARCHHADSGRPCVKFVGNAMVEVGNSQIYRDIEIFEISISTDGLHDEILELLDTEKASAAKLKRGEVGKCPFAEQSQHVVRAYACRIQHRHDCARAYTGYDIGLESGFLDGLEGSRVSETTGAAAAERDAEAVLILGQGLFVVC